MKNSDQTGQQQATSSPDATGVDAPDSAGKKHVNPLLRLALEVGPLVVFFIANSRYDLFVATGLFMAATVVALTASYLLEKRIPVLPLVSGIFVIAFGALTLILNDELFIKLKPTIVNCLFAAILLGGLALGRPLLRPLLGQMLPMTDEGWKKLTLRWGLFFIVLAIINEVVWRNFSTDFWVSFKLFGIMPLTLVFSFAQMPLIRRYSTESAEDKNE